MVIGILSVRDERYHPNRRLMEAASRLGHRATLIHTRDCLAAIAGGKAGLTIQGSDRPDILLPRIGATINDYALGVVRHFELAGVPVVNGFQAILLARNKFMSGSFAKFLMPAVAMCNKFLMLVMAMSN